MAVPTVGGQDVAGYVRLLLGDADPNNYEFTDADLTRLLARAMIEFRHYRPYVKQSTFTTVADQYLYALPVDCLELKECIWRPLPGLSSTGLAAWFNTLFYPTILFNADWGDEALNRVRQEIAERYDDLGRGQWAESTYLTSYSPTSYVILYPTPTADGLEVTLRYLCEHPQVSNNYFTVNPGEAHHVGDLLLAQCYDVRISRIGSSANVTRTGTTDIRWDARTLSLAASNLRQDVEDHLRSFTITHG